MLDFDAALARNMVEWKLGGVEYLSQYEARVYVGDSFYLGNLIEQEFLIVLHVGYYYLQLIVCRLAGDQ